MAEEPIFYWDACIFLEHLREEPVSPQKAEAIRTILQDNKDAVDVLVIPRSTYTEVSGRRLLKAIRSRLGPEIEIRIHIVDKIPREPNGKFRAVKSRVGSISQ